MSESWVAELAAAVDARTHSEGDAEWDARIPEFERLSDGQVSALLDLVVEEGRARGFGSYWHE